MKRVEAIYTDPDHFRRVFSYNPDTGELIRLLARKSTFRNRVVSSVGSHGYIQTSLATGVVMLAHRIIWMMVHGRWPTHDIDHKNGVRTDNRLCNLREATRSENHRNKAVRSDNSLGIKGVIRRNDNRPRKKRFVARIKVDGKEIRIGTFLTVQEAGAAYEQAAKKYFGEFARPQ